MILFNNIYLSTPLINLLLFQVCQVSMPTLTLARYILETSLMEYKFNVVLSESLLAAATLVLAMKVTNTYFHSKDGISHFNDILEHLLKVRCQLFDGVPLISFLFVRFRFRISIVASGLEHCTFTLGMICPKFAPFFMLCTK